jgi:hypothetical protein
MNRDELMPTLAELKTAEATVNRCATSSARR